MKSITPGARFCWSFKARNSTSEGKKPSSGAGSARSTSTFRHQFFGLPEEYEARVVSVLFLIIAFFLLLFFFAPSSYGQEPPLDGLQLVGFGKCVKMDTKQVVLCATLVKEGEDRVLYIAVFDEKGDEVQELVKQDYNTGKEEILWRRPPVVSPDMKYPQKQK